jgi:hypothetical protein
MFALAAPSLLPEEAQPWGAHGLLQGNLGFGIMFQKHSERHTHSIFARSAVSLAAVTDANNLNRIVAPSK